MFSLCAGSNPINAFISFRHFYCIIFSYVPFNHVWTTILTSLNGTRANIKTHMRDAINASTQSDIDCLIFSNRNDEELIMNCIQTIA